MFVGRHALARILVLLLPAAVFAAVVVYYLNLQEQKGAENTLGKTATATIAALDRQLDSDTAVLKALANSTTLDDGNLPGFIEHARRVISNHEGWFSIVVTDEGRLLASTANGVIEPPRPLMDPRNATAVFRTARPSVSGVYPANERVSEPSYVISVPVIRNGTVKYTVSAVVRAWNLHQVLNQLPVPEGGRIGFLDQDGKIIARSNSTNPSDRLIGKLPSQSVLDGARRDRNAVFQGTPVDGDPVYMIAKQHELSGWTALISAPVVVLDAPRRWMLGVATGGAFATLLATIVVGMTMARATTRLMNAERRVADLEVESEKRKSTQQFRTLADSIPQLAWMARPDGHIFWYNKRWHDYTGTTLDEMEGGAGRRFTTQIT